ncbi:MAG: M20 family metallopeptidase [bacterium]
MSIHPELLDLLQRLVAFRTDVTEVEQAAWLQTLTTGWGGTARVDEVLPGRVNFLATFPGRDPARSILFEAHGDTVGGEVPLRLDPAAGLLYGRGACDPKGALAAILFAMRRVLTEQGRPPVTVHVASTCKEESGCEGVRALLASGFRADLAVVGEPTRLTLIRAHKGAWRCRITTRGRAAHSSAPDRGVNAIYGMRRVLEMLEQHYPPALAARHDALLGSPTLSVGTIRGGVAVNVVPDTCEIEVDWRLIPGQSGGELLADLCSRLPEAEVVPCESYPPFREADDSPVVARMQRACMAALGQPAPLGAVAWAANAGFLREAGIPCVIFGPGDIAQAHTAGEFVELRQVEQAAEVYARMMMD